MARRRPSGITASSFTFTTPAESAGYDQVQVTNLAGASGLTPAAGYIYSSRIGYDVGENIGWGTLADSTPRAIVAAWMASPGHRANILNSHFRDTAIGVSPRLPSSLTRSQAGGIYTQDFGVITTR